MDDFLEDAQTFMNIEEFKHISEVKLSDLSDGDINKYYFAIKRCEPCKLYIIYVTINERDKHNNRKLTYKNVYVRQNNVWYNLEEDKIQTMEYSLPMNNELQNNELKLYDISDVLENSNGTSNTSGNNMKGGRPRTRGSKRKSRRVRRSRSRRLKRSRSRQLKRK